MERTEVQVEDVHKHNSRSSCWVVIHSKVWDLTEFIDEHPGGAHAVLQCAGKDGTDLYDQVHDTGLIKDTLSLDLCRGVVRDPSALEIAGSPKLQPANQPELEPSELEPSELEPPMLNSIVSVQDFAKMAKKYLSEAGWAYYASAADDELCVEDAKRVFRRIMTRPRILRRVEPVCTRTNILGYESSLPLYFSPTGQGRYACKDAEAIISRVAGEEGLHYCMPTGSSHELIFQARVSPTQPLFFQLYTGRDKERTKDLLRKVERLGAAAIFLTVDSPVLGKRERDDRVRAAAGEDTISATSGGLAKTSSLGLLNPLLCWEDLKWIRETTKLPLVLKGVQTVEDAVLAHAHGVDGIVLSNHGGRSQDTAQPPILTLLEIRRHAPYLLSPPIRKDFQVLLDGSIRRGTDIIKAIALGATAVGIGRPVLYSMCGGYGQQGLQRLCQILRSEISTNMALAGAACVDDLVPEMINSQRAEHEMSRRIKL